MILYLISGCRLLRDVVNLMIMLLNISLGIYGILGYGVRPAEYGNLMVRCYMVRFCWMVNWHV